MGSSPMAVGALSFSPDVPLHSHTEDDQFPWFTPDRSQVGYIWYDAATLFSGCTLHTLSGYTDAVI